MFVGERAPGMLTDLFGMSYSSIHANSVPSLGTTLSTRAHYRSVLDWTSTASGQSTVKSKGRTQGSLPTLARAPLTLITERPMTAEYYDARVEKYSPRGNARLHPRYSAQPGLAGPGSPARPGPSSPILSVAPPGFKRPALPVGASTSPSANASTMVVVGDAEVAAEEAAPATQTEPEAAQSPAIDAFTTTVQPVTPLRSPVLLLPDHDGIPDEVFQRRNSLPSSRSASTARSGSRFRHAAPERGPPPPLPSSPTQAPVKPTAAQLRERRLLFDQAERAARVQRAAALKQATAEALEASRTRVEAEKQQALQTTAARMHEMSLVNESIRRVIAEERAKATQEFKSKLSSQLAQAKQSHEETMHLKQTVVTEMAATFKRSLTHGLDPLPAAPQGASRRADAPVDSRSEAPYMPPPRLPATQPRSVLKSYDAQYKRMLGLADRTGGKG